MVVYTCHPSIWELEAGGPEVQGHLPLHSEFKALSQTNTFPIKILSQTNTLPIKTDSVITNILRQSRYVVMASFQIAL